MQEFIKQYIKDHTIDGHFVVQVPFTFDSVYNETMLMCADFTVENLDMAANAIATEFANDQVEVTDDSLTDYFNMQVAYDRPLIDGFSVAEEYNEYVDDNLFE